MTVSLSPRRFLLGEVGWTLKDKTEGGVEKIYTLQIEDIRQDIERSAEIIKEDLKIGREILEKKFGIR